MVAQLGSLGAFYAEFIDWYWQNHAGAWRYFELLLSENFEAEYADAPCIVKMREYLLQFDMTVN